jgi:hypothetical protein
MKMNGGEVSSVDSLRSRVARGDYKLFGIFLYSDIDASFIKYLTDAHEALSVMSGADLFLFWFEHFDKNSAVLWRPDEKLPTLASRVSRNEAAVLGIPDTSTPCIVFCRTLSAPNGTHTTSNATLQHYVVYSFDNKWQPDEFSEHFKAILSASKQLAVTRSALDDSEFFAELERRLQAIKIKKWIKRVVTVQRIGDLLKAIATGKSIFGIAAEVTKRPRSDLSGVLTRHPHLAADRHRVRRVSSHQLGRCCSLSAELGVPIVAGHRWHGARPRC